MHYYAFSGIGPHFHKLAHKMLEAPTEAIVHMIQGHNVDWLQSVKKTRASKWFKTYWTREHGNYTNASVGHVGNNKIDWLRISLEVRPS
jgi:hypothetical protein